MNLLKSASFAIGAAFVFAAPLALAQSEPAPGPQAETVAPAEPAAPIAPAAAPAAPAAEAAAAGPAQAEPSRACRTRKSAGEACACLSAPEEIGAVETPSDGPAMCVVRPAAAQ